MEIVAKQLHIAADASPHDTLLIRPMSPAIHPGRVPRRPPVLRIALASISIAIIFLLDTFTLLGSAVAVLYVMPLLFIGGDLARLKIIPWAFACGVLTLVSFGINHGQHLEISAVLRMVISLAANVATTFLIFRAKAMFGTLLESEDRYKTIFDSLAVGIWEHDFRPVQAAIDTVRASGVENLRQYIAENPAFVVETRRMVRITDVNQTAVQLMKVKTKAEFFTNLSDFLPETDDSFAECILAIDEHRPLFQSEAKVTARDGEELDIIVAIGFSGRGALDRVPASILNVTQSKRLGADIVQTRELLERAQRAAALGQMTASIAHELNQPLSAIRSYADAACRWLRRDPPEIAEADEALQNVVEAVVHADNVIKGVRALTGKAHPTTTCLALDTLIEDSAVLMQREITNHGARLSLKLDAAGINIEADRVLIQQVLVNLITNALQAMDLNSKCTRLVTISSGIGANDVAVTVSDTGPGWPPKFADAAFEAFQTTKPDGMGLGLSICRSAIEAHHGTIAIASAAGGGASVTFTLPIAQVQMQPVARQARL